MSSKRRRFSVELNAKVALEALRGEQMLQEIPGPSDPGPRLEAPDDRGSGGGVLEGRRTTDPGP